MNVSYIQEIALSYGYKIKWEDALELIAIAEPYDDEQTVVIRYIDKKKLKND